MSIVLGRWPLIPEQRCTVSLPQDVFGTPNVSQGDAPNIFCERRLQIDLAKIASSILSSNNGKPCTEPATINRQMEVLKMDLIEKLPPAFRLGDPDEKWDEQLPHLRRQRQMFRISVFATMCMLLRPMIIIPAKAVRALSASDRRLVLKHRISLIDAAMKVLDSVAKLHSLMGGKHNRFFLLSFFTLEPAVLLGIYLMTPKFGTKEGRQGSSAFHGIAADHRDMWKHGFQKMEEAVARLNMLSEVSSIARTGLKVLVKMMTMINTTDMARSYRGEVETMSISSSSKSQSPTSTVSCSRTSTRSQPSAFPPDITNGFPVSGQPNAVEASRNLITPAFPYDYVQFQEKSPLVRNTYNYEIQDQYSACDDTMNREMNLSNENMTNDLPFLNADATIPWPEITAQTAAAGVLMMDANHFAPDMAMDQNLDWSWVGNHGQQTAWFET
jgi:hypothetical protein